MTTETVNPSTVNAEEWNRTHAQPFGLTDAFVPVLYTADVGDQHYVLTGIFNRALYGRPAVRAPGGGPYQVAVKDAPVLVASGTVMVTEGVPEEYQASWKGKEQTPPLFVVGDASGHVLVGVLSKDATSGAKMTMPLVAAGSKWSPTETVFRATLNEVNTFPVAEDFIPWQEVSVYPLVAAIFDSAGGSGDPLTGENAATARSGTLIGTVAAEIKGATAALTKVVTRNKDWYEARDEPAEGQTEPFTILYMLANNQYLPFPDLRLKEPDAKNVLGATPREVQRWFDGLRAAQEESEGGGAGGSPVLPGNAPSPPDDDDEAARRAAEQEAARVAAEEEAARLAAEIAAEQQVARLAAEEQDAARKAYAAAIAGAQTAMQQADSASRSAQWANALSRINEASVHVDDAQRAVERITQANQTLIQTTTEAEAAAITIEDFRARIETARETAAAGQRAAQPPPTTRATVPPGATPQQGAGGGFFSTLAGATQAVARKGVSLFTGGSSAGEAAVARQELPRVMYPAAYPSGVDLLTTAQAARLGQEPGSLLGGPSQPSAALSLAQMRQQLADDQEMTELTDEVRKTSVALVQAVGVLTGDDGLVVDAANRDTLTAGVVLAAEAAWSAWMRTRGDAAARQRAAKTAAVKAYDDAATELGGAADAADAAERQIRVAKEAGAAFEAAETAFVAKASVYDAFFDDDEVMGSVRTERAAAATASRDLTAALPLMPASSAALRQQAREMAARAEDLRNQADAPPDVVAVAPIVVAADPAAYIASEGTFVDVSFQLTINGFGARLRPRVMRSAGGNGFGVMIAHLGGDKYNFGVSGQPRILRITKGGPVDVTLARVGGNKRAFHHVIRETSQDRAVAEMIPSAAGRRGMYLQYTVRGNQLRSLVVAVVGIPAKDL